MNTNRRMLILTFLLLSLLFVLQAQTQSNRQLSLEDAVRLAMKQNSDLESVRLDVERSDARVLEAWGYAMPSVDISGQYNHFIDKPVIFFPDVFLYGFMKEIDSTIPKPTGKLVPVSFTPRFTAGASLTVKQILFNGTIFVGVGAAKIYSSKLNFKLDTSLIGNSEMQHLDYAYASSLVRTFLEDETLVLTIRGRKYTPKFSFRIGNQHLTVESVQTEVDAGYEGKNQVALIEAKNSKTDNTIIRQLFFPFRQWSHHTAKTVKTLFFEKWSNFYSLWQFEFSDINDYNSIHLTKCCRYEIVEK